MLLILHPIVCLHKIGLLPALVLVIIFISMAMVALIGFFERRLDAAELPVEIQVTISLTMIDPLSE
jgi:hypothetical protein